MGAAEGAGWYYWVGISYIAKRFGAQEEDPKKSAENIANALKEGVKTIDAWFEECIKELEAEQR